LGKETFVKDVHQQNAELPIDKQLGKETSIKDEQ
jgi:hypothetical protein